jgi:RimJ/RimL family protein N-acetyltransferase
MPYLYGEGIRLRAMERGDIPMFVSWFNDPDVTLGLGMTVPLGQADEEGWFERTLALPAEQHPLVIEVRHSDPMGMGMVEWLPVGNCGFHKINWQFRSAEFGIVIGEKDFRNKGVGTSAVKLLLEHGFHNLNLHRVSLQVHADNPGAIRCYEKAGFRLEGRLREKVFKRGKYVDMLVMSVLVQEYGG